MTEVLKFTRALHDLRSATAVAAVRAAEERRQREREQTGYERGRADGEAAARAGFAAQQAELDRLQRELFQSLSNVVPQIVQESEQSLVALTLEIAQKLVTDVPLTPELVEATVREALAQVGKTAEVAINLHPDDLALLQQHNSPLLTASAAGRQLSFHASSEVTRGGCTVCTRFGTVDARRETKLELLKKTLLP